MWTSYRQNADEQSSVSERPVISKGRMYILFTKTSNPADFSLSYLRRRVLQNSLRRSRTPWERKGQLKQRFAGFKLGQTICVVMYPLHIQQAILRQYFLQPLPRAHIWSGLCTKEIAGFHTFIPSFSSRNKINNNRLRSTSSLLSLWLCKWLWHLNKFLNAAHLITRHTIHCTTWCEH